MQRWRVRKYWNGVMIRMEIGKRQLLFENPSAAYRGKPFWALNGKLEEQELKRQIKIFKEMGFGGFFMHSRTGLETEYLGEEWFRLMKECADYAESLDMEAWLYDEDRWPSGSAGGMAAREMKYRASFLEAKLYSPAEWEKFRKEWTGEWAESGKRWKERIHALADCENHADDDNVINQFAVNFHDNDMISVRSITAAESIRKDETAVVFIVRLAECNDNYNGFTYLDTMNRDAVAYYMQLTHERYGQECGDCFGRSMRGIFTDEPHRGPLFTEFSGGKVNAVPYTSELFREFQRRFGYDLSEKLPELFFRYEGHPLSRTARDYIELCQELFLENFAEPVQRWCMENGLFFTGHLLHEDSMTAQTAMQGSLMRFYEYMDYPGVDVLTEHNDSWWIVKQAASVARQLGKKYILSELYGCTGWQMSLEDYKQTGDWQALLGINLRCPHLSWYTMKGETKRDYPASIFYQSAWYKEYHFLEDYFSRINAVMEDTQPVCSVLVLNPIESVWARTRSGAFDGLEACDKGIQRLEKRYQDLFWILTKNHIDFDYGEEDLLNRYASIHGSRIQVGEVSYTTVLVAGMETIRTSTLMLLEDMVKQGGNVIFVGEIPRYADVMPSVRIRDLAERASVIPFEEEQISSSLNKGRLVHLSGKHAEKIAVQVRKTKQEWIVFLLNSDRETSAGRIEVRLDIQGHPEIWDARTGKVYDCPYTRKKESLELAVLFKAGEEKLLVVSGKKRVVQKEEENQWIRLRIPENEFSYSLLEENVCVLDWVRTYTKDGRNVPETEVLKADRRLREMLRLSYRGGEMLQPWYVEKCNKGVKQVLADITLEYRFEAESIARECFLAVEDLENVRRILLNDKEMPKVSKGKWLDHCFERIKVPQGLLVKGTNILKLEYGYYKNSGIEAVYLLGGFGVRLEAGSRNAVITELPGTLKPGDIRAQGLPFYTGGIRYFLTGMQDGRYRIRVRETGAATVRLIGKKNTSFISKPYEAVIEDPKAVELIFGRRNTFGPLHQLPAKAESYNPGSFVTEGAQWSDDYVLMSQGLAELPEIWIERKDNR